MLSRSIDSGDKKMKRKADEGVVGSDLDGSHLDLSLSFKHLRTMDDQDKPSETMNLLSQLDDNKPLEISKGAETRRVTCKYCRRIFVSPQALGGHLNAHRRERAAEHWEKARHEIMNQHMMMGGLGAAYYTPYPLPFSSSSVSMQPHAINPFRADRPYANQGQGWWPGYPHYNDGMPSVFGVDAAAATPFGPSTDQALSLGSTAASSSGSPSLPTNDMGSSTPSGVQSKDLQKTPHPDIDPPAQQTFNFFNAESP